MQLRLPRLSMENNDLTSENQSSTGVCSNNGFDEPNSSVDFGVHIKNLGRDWIPECSSELKPMLDQRFNDLDQGFNFYKEYGRVSGFDVRRSTEKSDRFGNTITKYFVCSRSGRPDSKNVEANIQRRRRTVSTKCECNAELVLGLHRAGGFYVKKFKESHNHPFAGKGGMQFLRCSRSLTEFHKRFIVGAGKSNIGASRAYAILKSMVGSYEDIGATVVDFKNFSRDIKQYIGKHDADMIIQKFRDIQSSSDTGFKFEYRTDSENHLTQLFWADGEGRKNYEVFGDVVSFDATYRTNRYGMVFIPLIGIDNHWKSVTFGAMLLEHEDNENFIWGCEAFKKVFCRNPKCFVTDQDLAMKAALDYCFPLVKHRLCMWHIMKKFPSKLGTIFCAESGFMDKINKLIWSDHITKEEFEEGWKVAIDEFDLKDNVWLNEMFNMRSLWIPAYFNDEPMVGLLRTTSRSESSNFYFGHYVQKGDTLAEFFLCYQSAIEKQRNTTKKLTHYDDFTPNTLTDREIERDAVSQYTRSLFYKVQEEIKAGGRDITVDSMSSVNNTRITKLRDPLNTDKIFEVALNMDTKSVDCSCKLFTRVGYLCSHAFFCLGICGIRKIPKEYVSNRWLKNAVERFSTLELGEISDQGSRDISRRVKIQDCWFEFQGCLSDASGNSEILDYIKKGLHTMRNHITVTMKKPKTRLNSEQIEDILDYRVVEEITVQNPNKSNNKGSRKRLASGAEKTIAGNKRKARKCATCKEYVYHDSRTCPEKN